MMLKRALVLAAIAAAMGAVAATKEDTFDLKWNLKEGQSYKQKVSANIDFQGTPIDVTATAITTCKSVKDGMITLLSQTKDLVIDIGGGQTMEQPDTESTAVQTERGRLVKVTGESFGGGDEARLGNAFSFFFPDKPVKVGETYEFTIPADEKLGLVELKCKYQVVERKDMKGKDVLVFKVDQMETGASPISISGTFAVEIKTGISVFSDFTFKNMPQQGMLLDGKWKAELVE